MTTFSLGCASQLWDAASVRRGLTPVLPARVGRYRVIARMGQGGMGEVFLAVDEHDNGVRKLVVIKLLHAHLHNDPTSVRAFLEEGRVALCMSHASIVQSLDVGEHEGRHYLVMEFLHGQTLQSLLLEAHAAGARIPTGVAVRIVADALEGLDYMHEARGLGGELLGLVHRDICPNNLFVTYYGETKLLDFGISKCALPPSSTQVALLKGKLCYLPPELASGQQPDVRSDVWSMGAVLWEALCGRRLFDGPSEVATLQQILQMPIESAYPHDVDVPVVLHRILMRALTRDPAARYACAAEMRDDLGDWLGSEGRTASRQAVVRYVSDVFADALEYDRTVIREQLALEPRARHSLSPSSAPQGLPAPVPLRLPPPLPAAAARTQPPPSKRSPDSVERVVWAAGVGMLLLIVAVLALRRDLAVPSPEQAVLAAAPGTSPAAAVAAVAAPTEPPNAVALASKPGETASASVDEASRSRPRIERPKARAARREERASEADDERERSRVAVQRSASDRPAASSKTAADTMAPAAEGAQVGYLTLDTEPWSEVFFGARSLGKTPLVKHGLPPGEHELTLRNEALGIERAYRVTIEPASDVRKRLAID